MEMLSPSVYSVTSLRDSHHGPDKVPFYAGRSPHQIAEDAATDVPVDEYIPPRNFWKRASSVGDLKDSDSRNTAFYGFYDEILSADGWSKRETVRQSMLRRRPSFF